MRLSGVNVSTINIINTCIHTKVQPSEREYGFGCVCECVFVIASLANRPDDGKALSYTHIRPYYIHKLTHTHTFYPAKAQIHRYVCVAFYHCPYLWECHLNVCANSSQIRVLGNRGASYAFRSVLRQPSLCKHLSPCILFSAILKIAFDFFVFIRSKFFFVKLL